MPELEMMLREKKVADLVDEANEKNRMRVLIRLLVDLEGTANQTLVDVHKIDQRLIKIEHDAIRTQGIKEWILRNKVAATGAATVGGGGLFAVITSLIHLLG